MTPIRRIALALVALVSAAVAAGAVAPGAAQASTRAEERAVVRLVNQIRAQHGLKALKVVPALTRAARLHSRDMGRKRYFAHVTPTGRDFTQRILAQRPGRIRWMAENIGWGLGETGTAAGIVQAWMNSAPHRKNLLDRRLTRVGIGAWQGTFRGYSGAIVYTANFAG